MEKLEQYHKFASKYERNTIRYRTFFLLYILFFDVEREEEKKI